MPAFGIDRLRPGGRVATKTVAGLLALVVGGGVSAACEADRPPDIQPRPTTSAKRRPYCGPIGSDSVYGGSRVISRESFRLLIGQQGADARAREADRLGREIHAQIEIQNPPDDLDFKVSAGVGYLAVEEGQQAKQQADALAELLRKELNRLDPEQYVSGGPNLAYRADAEAAVINIEPTNCQPVIRYSPR